MLEGGAREMICVLEGGARHKGEGLCGEGS